VLQWQLKVLNTGRGVVTHTIEFLWNKQHPLGVTVTHFVIRAVTTPLYFPRKIEVLLVHQNINSAVTEQEWI